MLVDVVKGNWGGLLEHLVFLGVFALLLFLSYGLSVRARTGRTAEPAPPAAPAPAVPMAGAPAPGAPGPSGNLSRTQEFALAALNRLQQRVTPAFGSPRPQAPVPPAPSPQQAPQTVVDAQMPQPAAQDANRTVRSPRPPQRPAPPDATRPLPLPDSPDQQQ
jgi:hypothetical protein